MGSNAVLVFDGLFLHRPELVEHWDVSVYLDADRHRDEEWLDYLLSELPPEPGKCAAELDRLLEQARWPRYRQGWRSHVDQIDPAHQATVVIDNNELAQPSIVEACRPTERTNSSPNASRRSGRV